MIGGVDHKWVSYREYGAEIDKAFHGFSESYLSSETKVRVYSVYDKQSGMKSSGCPI